jgi:hypothetical protein
MSVCDASVAQSRGVLPPLSRALISALRSINATHASFWPYDDLIHSGGLSLPTRTRAHARTRGSVSSMGDTQRHTNGMSCEWPL